MPQLVWLVTGCSTGFGEQFVKTILERGDKAIATARKLESIDHLAALGAKTLQLDVTAPLAELETKVKEAFSFNDRIDVLVSNAGYAQYGPIEEISHDDLLKQFNTNFFGVHSMIQAIMRIWRKQESGFFVNISSITPVQDIQGFGAYGCSKAAVDKLMSQFAEETAHLGYIKTLNLHPGQFRTLVTSPEKNSFPADSPNYQHLADFFKANIPILHGSQPGSPEKLAHLLVDLVKDEGIASGKGVPRKLPVGKDAIEAYRAHVKGITEIMDAWEEAVSKTDVQDDKTFDLSQVQQ